MQPAYLHCSSYIFWGPNYDHEKKWFCTPFEKCLSILFWNSQTAALAVSLTPEQLDFFNVRGTRPHISLAKPTHCHWQGVGEFVATCQKETDWTVS